MEDLQDCLEDSRYSRAVSDPHPRPTRLLKLPSIEEAAEYFEALQEQDPSILSFENVMSSPLGYFLVSLPARARFNRVKLVGTVVLMAARHGQRALLASPQPRPPPCFPLAAATRSSGAL